MNEMKTIAKSNRLRQIAGASVGVGVFFAAMSLQSMALSGDPNTMTGRELTVFGVIRVIAAASAIVIAFAIGNRIASGREKAEQGTGGYKG